MSGFTKAYLRKSLTDRLCDFQYCKIRKGDFYVYFSGRMDYNWCKERRCLDCAYRIKTKSTEYLRNEIEELWNEKNRSNDQICKQSSNFSD